MTTKPGPVLELLTRRLAECPPDFLFEPKEDPASRVSVGAVVSDLLRSLGHPELVYSGSEVFEVKTRAAATHRHRRLVLIAAWLLHDPWFLAQGGLAPDAFTFLKDGLVELAGLVEPRKFITDPDRREELARLALLTLGYRPEGESEEEAADRLTTIDSAQRKRLIAATVAAETARLDELNRLRKVREAMERKKAEEAAASYGRE